MLILYQDIIMSIHGVMVLIGFMDRRLFCNSSDDLIESYDSSSTFCTISGTAGSLVSVYILFPPWLSTVYFWLKLQALASHSCSCIAMYTCCKDTPEVGDTSFNQDTELVEGLGTD